MFCYICMVTELTGNSRFKVLSKLTIEGLNVLEFDMLLQLVHASEVIEFDSNCRATNS